MKSGQSKESQTTVNTYSFAISYSLLSDAKLDARKMDKIKRKQRTIFETVHNF